MTASASTTALPRAYTYRSACAAFDVSLAELERAVKRGDVRSRRVGKRGVRLHPDDLEREFGFPNDSEPLRLPSESAESIAEDLLA